MYKIKYLSLFSGIGGFELGIGTSGQCVGYCETDPFASQVYQRKFPTHKNFGDITKLYVHELPDFDLLVAGFPCQAFSIAGTRRGFKDQRGSVFFEIVRIVRQKRPRLLLLENVTGLLSHDQGATFATILTVLDAVGYDVQWQVLNSKNHGVAQSRERVYIVGHLRGTPRPEVFPFSEPNPAPPELCGHYTNTLTASYGSTKTTGSYVVEGEFDAQSQTHAKTSGSNARKATCFERFQRKDHVPRIRSLTPLECERLQGFPDGWTDNVPDIQRYKALGNAVTVTVIRDICAALFE